jgi:hypothetical protein
MVKSNFTDTKLTNVKLPPGLYQGQPVTLFNGDGIPFGSCPLNVAKIVFLDIDGVLQPCYSQIRFEKIENNEYLDAKNQLSSKFDKDYFWYDKYDLAAVIYDWRHSAVDELKRVLDATNAKIVLSSDWRAKPQTIMMGLFQIHGLDKYYIDNTIYFDIYGDDSEEIHKKSDKFYANKKYKHIYDERAVEILEYVRKNKHITHYVAIDDRNLSNGLGKNFVSTAADSKLTKDTADECISILMS